MKMMAKLNLILLCALVSISLLADEPLLPPAKVVAWSANHHYFVESLPDGDTTVYRMPKKTVLWKIPGWGSKR